MTAPRQPFFPADQSIRKDNDSPIAVQLLGTVDYLTAWDMQADLAAQRARGDISDTIIVLEHPSRRIGPRTGCRSSTWTGAAASPGTAPANW